MQSEQMSIITGRLTDVLVSLFKMQDIFSYETRGGVNASILKISIII